jgi:uncharacterized phage protein
MAVDVIPAPSIDLKRIHFVESRISKIEKRIQKVEKDLEAVNDLQSITKVDLGWEIATLSAKLRTLRDQLKIYRQIRTELPEVCPACRGSQRSGSGMGGGTCMLCGGTGLPRKREKRK